MGIADVEKLALNLSEEQRALLARNLLHSLPAILFDEDEGVAEALRRDGELEVNSLKALSLEQLDFEIRSRRS